MLHTLVFKSVPTHFWLILLMNCLFQMPMLLKGLPLQNSKDKLLSVTKHFLIISFLFVIGSNKTSQEQGGTFSRFSFYFYFFSPFPLEKTKFDSRTLKLCPWMKHSLSILCLLCLFFWVCPFSVWCCQRYRQNIEAYDYYLPAFVWKFITKAWKLNYYYHSVFG